MGSTWFVVYTKPKKEELVKYLLERARLVCFLPKLRTWRFVNSHREEVIKPLFPSYLFTCFSYPEDYNLVRWTRGVKKVLGTEEGPLPVPEGMVDFIKANSENGIVEIKPRPLKKGDCVRILHGPFKGLTAVFEKELKDKERCMILLDALYNLRVEIKSYYLAPLSL